MIYLASPYSDDDYAVEQCRFEMACECAAELIKRGHRIYSPIAHSHPIAVRGNMDGDWDTWREMDEHHIKHCYAVWVLKLDGWHESKGVQAELALAKRYCKPVCYVNPDGCTVEDEW